MSGQVGISIDYVNGQVIVEFSRNVCHVEFSPQQAVDFAEAITRKALKSIEGTPQIIIPPSSH